jgi:predicted O-linked N-acetylglucosamine transferase (SPINDLY family)
VREGRAHLRAQMSASPLCDITAYVNHFESLLKKMWTVHCAKQGERFIEL